MGNLTEKMVMIPARLIPCNNTTAGFIAEFHHRLCSAKTQIEVFSEIEDELETYFGKRKFSDFQSFRVLLTRHNKKKKLTNQQKS
jgi:prephenate dehydratase